MEFDRLGLEVTEEEFNENVDSMRTQMQEEIANETASAAQFQQYLEGMGLTFSQYWQDEYTRVALRNDLKTQKVREYILSLIHIYSSYKSADRSAFLPFRCYKNQQAQTV